MILADTSIWIEHFRRNLAEFAGSLADGEVVMHPFVLGELMLSGVHRHRQHVRELRTLTLTPPAAPDDVLHLIEARQLDGRGIGYVDAALLASTLLTPDVRLLTLDRRLGAVAEELGVGISI